jgi:transposase
MVWTRGKAYSQDLRERVFQASDAGMRVGQIAAALMVSIPYVSKALSRRRLTGEITARAQRCHVPSKLAGLHDRIRERIAVVPDTTLPELKAWIAGEHQVATSVSLLSKTLLRLNLTVKKRPFRRPSKTVPMSPRHARPGGRSNPRLIPES